MSTMTDPSTGETFRFTTRPEWGARAPRSKHAVRNGADGTFMHHTVTPGTNPAAEWRAVQNWHMDARNFHDIGYSFGIGLDGTIFEGRGFGVAGGHTAGFNSTSHAVTFIANTDASELPDIARRAWKCVHRMIVCQYGEPRIRGHRQVASTACPGKHAWVWLQDGCVTIPIPTEPTEPTEPTVPEWEEPIMLVVRDKETSKLYRLGDTKRELSGNVGTELATLLGQTAIPAVSGELLGRFTTESAHPTVQQIAAAIVDVLPDHAAGTDIEEAVAAGLATAFAAAAEAVA